MKSKQPANFEDRAQGELNPKTSLPYKFTVAISLGVFAILLLFTAYYYGVFRF